MKLKKRLSLPASTVFILFCTTSLLLMNRRQLYGQANTPTEYQPQRLDSVNILRKEYRGREPWEQVVSSPGEFVSIPLMLISKGAEDVAGYVYETKLIPRTRDFFTSDDGTRELYLTYSERSAGGVEYIHRKILGPVSKLRIKATHAFSGKRQQYRLQWRRVQFREKSPFLWAVEIGYRYLKGEKFYGLGPGTERDNFVIYDHEYSNATLGVEFHLTKDWVIFGLYRYDHNNIYTGIDDEAPSITDYYTRETLPGLGTRVKIERFQAGVELDSRNRLGNPTSGNQTILSGSLYDDVGANFFNFWKAMGDFNQYIHFGHNRVLKVRFGFEITEPVNGGSVPFYYLSQLGVQETIRGYDRGRFRDLDMALASLEYTIPFWYRMDSFLFIDAGEVAQDIRRDFNWKYVDFAIGGGLKIRNSKDVVATLQVAVGRERIRFYFDLN